MVGGMSIRIRAITLRRWCIGLVAVLPLATFAQAVQDPTRPPVFEAVAADEGTAAVSLNRLTSIVRPKSGRAYAVIDGNVVHQGEAVSGGRLAKINESTVELRTDGGREVLSLTPGIDKTISKLPSNHSTRRPTP